jgi:ferredoxin
MSFTEDLYAIGQPAWEEQLQHPFVEGLGNGTLPEERFKRWVLQDYRYLKEFARVFAWAAAKADRLESMAWYASVLELTLNTEMELHRAYAARFDLTPEELEAEPMWPTTRAYTDHHAYCLHFSHDTCRECIGRCPVSALSEKGHDKRACMQYTEHAMNMYIKKRYGLDTYACGLCQAGVPCTFGIPDAREYTR